MRVLLEVSWWNGDGSGYHQTPTFSQRSPRFNRGPENIWPAGHPERSDSRNVFDLFVHVCPNTIMAATQNLVDCVRLMNYISDIVIEVLNYRGVVGEMQKAARPSAGHRRLDLPLARRLPCMSQSSSQ